MQLLAKQLTKLKHSFSTFVLCASPCFKFSDTVGNQTGEVLALVVFIGVGKTEITQSYNKIPDSMKEDKAGQGDGG